MKPTLLYVSLFAVVAACSSTSTSNPGDSSGDATADDTAARETATQDSATDMASSTDSMNDVVGDTAVDANDAIEDSFDSTDAPNPLDSNETSDTSESGDASVDALQDATDTTTNDSQSTPDSIDTTTAGSCTDGVKDGSETDVDCGGGTCPSCGPNKMCLIPADCVGGECAGGTCTPDCTDSVKNGSETDVDCGGGTCPTCATGKGCKVDADCTSNACDATSLTCVASQCADHRQDGLETDVDCGGGTCPTCATGKGCKVDADCTSNACDATSLTCVASQCADHRQDGLETDVDCGGGTCPTCATGKGCKVDADCTSNACDATSLTCVASQCADHQKDGNETDVDCGGGTCPKCVTGKGCMVNTDCASNACDGISFICVANQCADHRQDGNESDVDCGGPVCAACLVGQKCNTNTDCSPGHICNASKVCQ